MNGPQDMGGLQGFGPVVPEANEPVFHGRWEERAMAMTLGCAMLGQWNIDMSRSARETMPPADYTRATYYEIWLHGLTKLLARQGLVSADEVAAGHALTPRRDIRPAPTADEARAIVAKGVSAERPLATPPRFAVGDRVRAMKMNPQGHTRLPRYVRGCVGTVELRHGGHVLPDVHALGRNEAQHLYTIVFDGREVWGADADPTLRVSVDAWESYLEPA
jgi:nitrile hydratase subunit beta